MRSSKGRMPDRPITALDQMLRVKILISCGRRRSMWGWDLPRWRSIYKQSTGSATPPTILLTPGLLTTSSGARPRRAARGAYCFPRDSAQPVRGDGIWARRLWSTCCLENSGRRRSRRRCRLRGLCEAKRQRQRQRQKQRQTQTETERQ